VRCVGRAWLSTVAIAVSGGMLLAVACNPALPVNLGYAENVPAAFVPMQNGVVIDVFEAKFRKEKDALVLTGYKEKLVLPSGRVVSLEFSEIGRERAVVTIDGRRRRMPTIGELKGAPKESMAFAPSLDGERLASAIEEGCTGSVHVSHEENYAKGVSSYSIACINRRYTFTFPDWTPEDEPPVTSFRVMLSIESSRQTPSPSVLPTPTVTPTPNLPKDPAAFCRQVDARLAALVRRSASDAVAPESYERSSSTIKVVVSARGLTDLADYVTALQGTKGPTSVDLDEVTSMDGRAVGKVSLRWSDPDLATCVALGHRRARLPLAAARPPQSTPAPEARSIRDYDAANLALGGIVKESTNDFVCFFTAPDGKGYWLRRGDHVRNGQLTDAGPRSVRWSLNDGKSVEMSIP
jgi:hypothetical protein